MAIAFDAASGGAIDGTNPKTWSHTCTGSGLILFVSVYKGGSGTISGVTYNSVAMTLINSALFSAQECSLWYLVAPATGAHTVSVTGSGTASIGGSSASYTGVAQISGMIENSTTNTGNTSSLATSLTTADDNCWTVLAAGVNITSLAASTGSTSRNIQNVTIGIFDSNAAVHPAGSTSMTVTSGGGTMATVMASITTLNHYTLTAVKGSFALSGFATTFLKAHNYVLTAVKGSFALTGFAATLVNALWTRIQKSVNTFTNSNKSS